jgi:hypothetical protein
MYRRRLPGRSQELASRLPQQHRRLVNASDAIGLLHEATLLGAMRDIDRLAATTRRATAKKKKKRKLIERVVDARVIGPTVASADTP